jgi:hypothetical protein
MRAPKTPHRSSSEIFFFRFWSEGQKEGLGTLAFKVFLLESSEAKFHLAILVIDLDVK